MRLSIISKGDARRTVPDSTFEGEFKEFAKNFETYRPKKKKHDGYFVRGELDGKRCNANLAKADVLVLDGDQSTDNEESAPHPELLHELLKENNINHFIYTTHSYNPPEKIKWRAVIECEMVDKDQLKPTLEVIFQFLNECEFPLVNVKENWTWSQPWFFPNREEDDGKYLYYHYFDGVPYLAEPAIKMKMTPTTTATKAPTHQYDADSSYRDNITAIRDGVSYYKELQNILYGMAKDGRAKDTIEADAEMLMLASKAANPDHEYHDKWLERFNNIPTYVQQAVDCEKDDNNFVDLDDIKSKDDDVIHAEVEFPPALAGQLCQNFYEMSPHPNQEISLVGAMGLISGIAGRKYNVIGTGLNIYATLLADSGIGKSVIKDGVNKALLASGVMNARTYSGPSRFTGPKAIYESLMNGMSKVCIIEEAGLVNESQAGDASGINRAMLDLYTSSGAGQYAGGENYSDSKNNIPVLASPSLSVVNVSTPKSYLMAMRSKGAELSGEIARMWLTRTLRDKAPLNTKRKKDFDKDVRNRINELIQFCMDKQDMDNPSKIVDLGVDGIDLEAESNYWVDLENKYKSEGDNLRRTICSRAFIKTLKLAAIVSVFNGHDNIAKEEFIWAKKAVAAEMQLIEQTFMYESTSDLSELVMNVVCPIVLRMLKGQYKNVKVCPNKEMRQRGMFSKTNITQALKNNRLLKELDDDPSKNNPKTGVEKCIEYMVRAELVYCIRGDALSKLRRTCKLNHNLHLVYQVTEGFKFAMEE